jgi:hypothetical protein
MYFPSNQGYIGIGSQGTAKTTAVVPQNFIKYLSDESGPTFEAQTLREGGDGQYDKSSVKTIYTAPVNFSCYARPIESTNLFAALLGSDTPSNLTTTPFHHTIVPKEFAVTTPVQPWLTVERMLVSSTNSKVEQFSGVKLSAISMEAEAGQPVKLTVEGTGLYLKLITTESSPTYETGNPFSFYSGTYMVNQSSTSNFDIKSFNISLRAINDEENQTVALTRHDIINHRFEAEVTIGLNYTDYQLYAKANYNAATTPSSSFSDGNVIINLKSGTGISERRLQVSVPKVRLTPIQIPLNAEVATMELTMAGMGFKQATTALVTVLSYNTVATSMPL